MKFINWKRITAPLAFAVMAGVLPVAGTAQTQPEGITPEMRQELEERFRNLPPEQQRQIEARLRNMSPEQIQQLAERYSNMTPEQRQQFEERFMQQGRGGGGGGGGRGGRGEGRGPGREGGGEGGNRWGRQVEISGEDRQKYLMTSAGITDVAVQNAIIAFVAEQAAQRQPVTEAALEVSKLLADKSATPAAINAAQENLTGASKAFRSWKEGALKALDEKVSYSKNPRVKSLLMLVGIIGDEAAAAGGFNAISPRGLAGGGDIMDMVPQTGRGAGGRGGRGGGRRGGAVEDPPIPQ